MAVSVHIFVLQVSLGFVICMAMVCVVFVEIVHSAAETSELEDLIQPTETKERSKRQFFDILHDVVHHSHHGHGHGHGYGGYGGGHGHGYRGRGYGGYHHYDSYHHHH